MKNRRQLRLGTRGSPLALWQARWIAERLQETTQRSVELHVVKTVAEKFPERSLTAMGVGVFTRELDDVLLRGEIDLAVHSLKDVPSELHPQLTIAAVPLRASAWDAWISADGVKFGALPPGSRIGTASPRRQAQLLAYRRDLEFTPLRGNIDTRLEKMRQLGLGGIVLAQAGLERLGRGDLITEALELEYLVPAVAQGALAVMTRLDNLSLREELCALEDVQSRTCVDCERSFLQRLRGGCQVPAGAYARYVDGGRVHIVGALATTDGRTCLRDELEGASADAAALGALLAQRLIGAGGEAILAELRGGGAVES